MGERVTSIYRVNDAILQQHLNDFSVPMNESDISVSKFVMINSGKLNEKIPLKCKPADRFFIRPFCA